MFVAFRHWYVLAILVCLNTASGAEGVRTYHAPFGLPVGIVTTVPVRFEYPEQNISYSGYLETFRLHPLAGTTLGVCSTLLFKLIELPFAHRPPQPTDVALSMFASSAGFSSSFALLQLAFPEASPLLSEVRFIQSRRQMFGQYAIQFANPEMRTLVRENLQQLGKVKPLQGNSMVSAVLKFDSSWICQEAKLELPHGHYNLAIPLPTQAFRQFHPPLDEAKKPGPDQGARGEGQ